MVRTDGSPAVGAVVTALRQGSGETLRTTTAGDGAFLLEGLDVGLYRVGSSEGAQAAAESWAKTGVLDLRLTLALPSDTLRVRVLGQDGGAVPRFDARLLLPSGYRKLTQQKEGELLMEGGPERWTGAMLEIWGARDGNDHGLGYAPTQVGPLAGGSGEMEVRMSDGPVLEGVVLGPDGPLATPVQVRLAPRDRWWETLDDDRLIDGGVAPPSNALPPRLPYEGLHLGVHTDSDGRFRVAFLRPGIVHELTIDVPEEFCWFERRQVRAGDGPLEIRLQRPALVRVTVLGPDQQPLSGVHVTVLSPGGNGFDREAASTTEADGVAIFGGKEEEPFARGSRLDPTQKYKLVVNANYGPGIIRDVRPWMLTQEVKPAGPPFFAEKALDDWTPADTTIQLELGHTVSGTVVDAQGRPLSGRYVGMCTPVGFGDYETATDGRFVFRGVPAGTIYMGLDDGGDMGGIVDRQRETMWDASFGARRRYSPESPPPVREWTKLDVTTDLSDVTFRLPATIRAEVVLPPPGKDEGDPADDRFSTRQFDATRVAVLHRTEEGWKYVLSLWPGSSEMLSEQRDRTLTVDGLLPGHTYAAWMTPVSGEHVYVEFTAEVGRLLLVRTPGAAIRGQILDRPPDSSRVRIDVRDDRGRWLRTRTPDPDGGFQVGGLPESNWTVRAWCRSAEDVLWVAEGTVRTGDRIELRLAPEPKEDDR